MIHDADACTGDARSAYCQPIGKGEKGPLGDANARWKVENKRRAADVGGIVLVLEESLTLLTV